MNLVERLKVNGIWSHAQPHSTTTWTLKLYDLYLLLRNLANYVDHKITTHVSAANSRAPGSAAVLGQTDSSLTTQTGNNTAHTSNTLPNHGPQYTGLSGSSQTVPPPPQPTLPTSKSDYMLLCSDDMGWLTTREDLNVSPISSDRELFDAFRHLIKRRKRWAHLFLSLKSIQRISFIKVSRIFH